jgi:hypothetical protein
LCLFAATAAAGCCFFLLQEKRRGGFSSFLGQYLSPTPAEFMDVATGRSLGPAKVEQACSFVRSAKFWLSCLFDFS